MICLLLGLIRRIMLCPTLCLRINGADVLGGVGGWAGDPSTPKEVSFVYITYSGDTWTLVDANKQSITASGSIFQCAQDLTEL